MFLLSEVETINFQSSLKNLLVIERSRNDKLRFLLDCRRQTRRLQT